MQKYSLIVGIGNPGQAYARTFHNTGILAVSYLVSKARNGMDDVPWKLIRGKHFKYTHSGSENPTYIIPTSFMNESGRSTKNALDYFGVLPNKLLVIHDDADLPLGEFKISSGQGSAGHKGIASIIDALGTKEFSRARIGIRSDRYSGSTHMKAEKFVLKNMTKADYRILKETFEKLSKELSEH